MVCLDKLADTLMFLYMLRFLKHCRIVRINTAQKMKFSIKDFFNKCDQIRSKLLLKESLITEGISNGKFHFLCSVNTLVQLVECARRKFETNFKTMSLSSSTMN